MKHKKYFDNFLSKYIFLITKSRNGDNRKTEECITIFYSLIELCFPNKKVSHIEIG